MKEYWRIGTSILLKDYADDGTFESRSISLNDADYDEINSKIGESDFLREEDEVVEEKVQETEEDEIVEEPMTVPVVQSVSQEEINELLNSTKEEKEVVEVKSKKKKTFVSSFNVSLKDIEKRIEECKHEIETLEKLKELNLACIEMAKQL